MGTGGGRGARTDGVTHMWLDIVIVAFFAAGIYSFAVLTGFEKRFLTRKTDRRAENLYDEYADSHASSGGSPRSTAAPGRTTRPTPGPAHGVSGTSAHR